MYGAWIKPDGSVQEVHHCSHSDWIEYEEAAALGWIRTVENSYEIRESFLMQYNPATVTRAALIAALGRFKELGKTDLIIEDTETGNVIPFDRDHPEHFLNAEIRRVSNAERETVLQSNLVNAHRSE